MATLPLRPPQFSDDVAWLPPWLQPNHSILDSQDIANYQQFQNLDSSKGESSQVKEPNLLTNKESKDKLCQLYLSGEEASPATLTPSCGKVLHFNLHLSTDSTSSIFSNPLLHVSQEDKPHSAQALLGTRKKSNSNIDHGSEFGTVPYASNSNYCRLSARQDPLNHDAKQNTLEILNSMCTECNDISDAVELSVAASEALVIHKIVQLGSRSNDLSASAILEVALRVKQARVDESKDSLCCFKDSGNNDILSDLGDSDMEDAYNDVGLAISILDNISLKDPSTSRVMETPMSEIPVEDEEVQCELQDDREVYSSNYFVTELKDINPKNIKQKDVNEVNDRSSSGFQSRWYGGWNGMEGDACGAMKSIGRKIVPNFFARETSYLSESVDVFPDQNSVVHNDHLSSNASEARKPVKDLQETAADGSFVSQEAVKDSTAFNDPLCSMVPCSISTENGDSLAPPINDNADQVLEAFKSLPTGTEISAEFAETNSGPLDEQVGGKKLGELEMNDVEAYPLIRGQLTSLKTYSLGEKNARLPSESTKSRNDDKDTTKTPLVRSMLDCNQEGPETMLLSMKQPFCCTKTSEVRKHPPFTSTVSCTAATNNRENHVEDACERLTQNHFEHNAEKGLEQQVHVENISTSPLVISHRSRRFKAPKLCVNSVLTANLLEDQAPASNENRHKTNKSPQDQYSSLPKGDIPTRKRVRFSDVDLKLQIPQGPLKMNLRSIASCKNPSSCRFGDRLQNGDPKQGASQEVKERLTKCRIRSKKKNIFQGLDFLLTGFSKKKEKDIEGLLRKYGGIVLTDVPAPFPHPPRRSSKFNAQKLPVVLSTKKLQTARFLYGCAVNAFLLKASWAYDSIRVGSVLPPDKYLILCSQSHRMLNQVGKSIFQNDDDYIFDKVGVMLHGTHKFCTKLAMVVKHGRGHVHKSLQWLVNSLEKKKISLGVIVAEDENRATRHLKKCASEQKIAVVPARWIIDSLIEGKLVSLPEGNCSLSNPRTNSVSEKSVIDDWSQEI